jgi:alpha-tubulin suppressor-like RCC1 family protein
MFPARLRAPRRAFILAFVAAAFAAAGFAACLPMETSTELGAAGSSEYPVELETVQSSLVASCSGTSGQWAGCRGHGCAVCAETTQSYPYYFVNHPLCDKNLTCDGLFGTCNANCPPPSNADKAPAAGQCNGTAGQWSGCRGNGCAVCSEKLTDYPFYFVNHPKCVRNDTCAGQFFTCNANCPAPTDADKIPAAGTCNGTSGQWAGCRGTGCSVCAEKLGDFPNYFKNHPNCVKNTTCAGQFFTCNSNCPAPTDADRAAPIPQCNGTPGQWAGCRGNGCAVCGEKLKTFPYYLANHPNCVENLTCDGQTYTCNANCPAPVEADKAPAAGVCSGTAGTWSACRGNGCAVCSEMLTDYPFYFHHHPRCVRNDTCAGQFFTCNENCPAPTDKEKLPPAGTCNGSTGGWNGCRGSGCSVCSELVKDFPNYFKNNPRCVKNTTCSGQFFTCNSNCPAPTDADRGSYRNAIEPFAQPITLCPRDSALVVAADNKWAVFVDGVRLKPADTANLEADWRRPAKYNFAMSAGTHVIAIHAADTAGGRTGLIANLKVGGMPFGGGVTEAPMDWQVLPTGQTPPANWTTAPSLAWSKPPIASDGCKNFWANDATFANNWKGLAGTSPRAWVWNRACDSAQTGWQRDNWYRLVVNIRCNSGSTTCPDGTACPLRNNNGVLQDIGICKGGACTKTACDDLPAKVDAAGNVILPASIADLADMSNVTHEDVDEDRGPVASAIDGKALVGACESGISHDLPDATRDELTKAAQLAGSVPLIELGISYSPKEIQSVLRPYYEATSPEFAKVMELAKRPSLAWTATVNASKTTPAYVEPQACDSERDPAAPFAGRDIIFVHGFNPDSLFGLHIGHSAEAARTWTNNREDFYSGYYKHKAEAYWEQHIQRYLRDKGHKNRYLTVAWSSNERMDYGVDAMLAQVSDAMRNGRGVITTPGDLRAQKGFCIPNCIVISHSTGAPIADVAMTIANETPTLKFISDHVKTHVAFEGAFGGSPFAVMGVSLSAALRFGTKAATHEAVCNLFLRLAGTSLSCPETLPDFSTSVLIDLLPSVADLTWKTYLERTPVPTLAVTGGHATSMLPPVKLLFPGFDDDTLTSDSTCATSHPWWQTPIGFRATNAWSLFDLGLVRTSNNPIEYWKTVPSAVRPLGYWIDQVVDPFVWGMMGGTFGGYAAAGCDPHLSPTGMLQPVEQDFGDATRRLKNHHSFIQTAAAHSIASITDEGRDYKKALGWRSSEETRVITDDSTYTLKGNDLRSRDGRDPGLVVAPAMKTMQRERQKGWRIRIGFRGFSKTFWIWKRRYMQLDQTGDKDQGDYVYENVAPTGPTPATPSLAACGTKRTIAAGWDHSCAVKPNGSVRCWGANSDGQLGNSSTLTSLTPVAIANANKVQPAAVISASAKHTCAIRRDGTVWCWGDNFYGTLGNGSTTSSTVPVGVADVNDAMAIGTGLRHTCALRRNGTVACWGSKDFGYLGNGDPSTPVSAIANKPVRTSVLVDATAIAVGHYHACALSKAGTVWCWGTNTHGQLGKPDFALPQLVPARVAGIDNVRSISAGRESTCAVRTDGSTWCWGANEYGQLGRSPYTASSVPTRVNNLNGAALTSDAGSVHGCALIDNGTVWCWGGNGYGQIGNGGTADPRAILNAQQVVGLSGVNALSSHHLHTCAMNPAGSVWCWGNNVSGKLGSGSESPIYMSRPISVQGL